MAISVRLDDEFVENARIYAQTEDRSVPKQIEHWAKIGKIMIENPDLPYEFVRETLISTAEVNKGLKKLYVRRTKRNRSI